MKKLSIYPLSCFIISKTMNLLQKNIYSDEKIYKKFKNFYLKNYEIDENYISFMIIVDNIGMIKKGKYIYKTNIFDIFLEVFDNKIELGFMNYDFDCLKNELKGQTNKTKEDLKSIMKNLQIRQITQIKELNHNNLEEAKNLRNRTFNYIKKIEQDTLDASLDRKNYIKCYKNNEINFMKYYVLENNDNKIIGLTGIYNEIEDEDDMCWIGWFCIDNNYRNLGLGKKLLDFSINKAKELNNKFLHLYTYDSKEFEAAINIYKKYGFVQYKPDFKTSKKDLYFKLELL